VGWLQPWAAPKEKDPGSAFGPESVPLATGSVPVVYWVPGPPSRPNPPSSRMCAADPFCPFQCHAWPWGRLDAGAPATT